MERDYSKRSGYPVFVYADNVRKLRKDTLLVVTADLEGGIRRGTPLRFSGDVGFKHFSDDYLKDNDCGGTLAEKRIVPREVDLTMADAAGNRRRILINHLDKVTGIRRALLALRYRLRPRALAGAPNARHRALQPARTAAPAPLSPAGTGSRPARPAPGRLSGPSSGPGNRPR